MHACCKSGQHQKVGSDGSKKQMPINLLSVRHLEQAGRSWQHMTGFVVEFVPLGSLQPQMEPLTVERCDENAESLTVIVT